MTLMALPEETTRSSDLVQFYNHLTRHVVPGPRSISYFIPFLLLPTALLIPPSLMSHRQLYVVFLPLIYAFQIHAWLQIGGLEVISLTLTLWSFVLLVLTDPRMTHRRIRLIAQPGSSKDSDKRRHGFVEEVYPKSLAKRISWVLTLLVSLRLAGWKIGDPSHDKTQPASRRNRIAYSRHAFIIIAQAFVILDAASCYVLTDPFFVTPGMSVDEPCPPASKDLPTLLNALRILPPRMLRSTAFAGQVYAMVTSMFYLPTIPVVALNAIGVVPDEWSPHTWPLLFGSFSAVGERGLRGLWGSWWHQVNRTITSAPGREVAKAMGIPTTSTLGYSFLTFSAFFFSGVMHMGMIPPEPASSLMSANMMRLYLGAFFWVQIPAFQIELVVSNIVATSVPSLPRFPMKRIFVLLWVAGWLLLTLPLLSVSFREMGYWRYFPLPISLFRGLAGKGWLMWYDIGRVRKVL